MIRVVAVSFLLCTMLFSVLSTDCPECKNFSCFGDRHICRPSRCLEGEAQKTFPPGFNFDLCGSRCVCCVPDKDAVCINLGGECQDNDRCPRGFQKLRNDQPMKCKGKDRVCCLKKKSKSCIALNGECREKCAKDGSRPIQKEITNVECGGDDRCCVHRGIVKCAKRGGTCGYKCASNRDLELVPGDSENYCTDDDIDCCRKK